MVLFLPLLNKAFAPSCAWGHKLVTLDILGASSSWLFFLLHVVSPLLGPQLCA